MPATSTTSRSTSRSFPKPEVESRLRDALERLQRDTVAMREPWEPTFDSLAVVNVVIVLEGVLPGIRIEPEKLVRKGGYQSLDDAVSDITGRAEQAWNRKVVEE